MKGTLYKTEESDWCVYELAVKKHYAGGVSEYLKKYPLHPHDAKQYQEEYDFYGATGFMPTQVDFEIVDGYAQLITTLSEEDYPELEGTVNLCNDVISDREIEKEAVKIHGPGYYAFVDGAKWMRDRLKNKQ